MDTSNLDALLKRCGLPGRAGFERTLSSSVTTAWGVAWDETLIARDLMQNFFDANRKALSQVVVSHDGETIMVKAPARFALERLFYLGSEKGEDDVGQYGEGFKAAATCLLRDHGVQPVCISGRQAVMLRVAAQAVAGTQIHPIEYDFHTLQQEYPGAVLLLPNCSVKLARAMQQGMTHFFHQDNPLLKARRWHMDEAFAVYDSADRNGHVFYRNLQRGEMEDFPVVLVLNKPIPAIERLVGKDRDRNAFGEKILARYFKSFVASAFRRGPSLAGEMAILEAGKPHWERGHPLLKEMAESFRWARSAVSSPFGTLFGDGFFARSQTQREPALQLQIDAAERLWRQQGRTALPNYFRMFGVPDAATEIQSTGERAREEARRTAVRPPTQVEYQAIRMLGTVLGEVSPEISGVFGKSATEYTVARTDSLMGELRSGRGYRSREVFLAESFFEQDFAGALATFLHEHAHIFGHDGSRGFTDALTRLLETIVTLRGTLDAFEADWNGARSLVMLERASCAPGDDDSVRSWVASLDQKQLQDLVRQVPLALLLEIQRGGRAKG